MNQAAIVVGLKEKQPTALRFAAQAAIELQTACASSTAWTFAPRPTSSASLTRSSPGVVEDRRQGHPRRRSNRR